MPTEPTNSVDDFTVLVTRPQHQSEELCALIAAAGGRSIHFPVLTIIPLEGEDSHQSSDQDHAVVTAIIDRLDDYDIALFISANAVEQGVARVRKQRGAWPSQCQLAVIGRGSAQALVRLGLQAHICPEQGFNSEALLALSTMRQVQGKRIVIFRGVGGREKLANELRQRGAQVDYAEVYRRCRAALDLAELQHDDQLQRINVIIVASNESLQYLYDIAGQAHRDWLLRTPLAVISRRCAELAEQLGFNRYCIASEASNQALFEAVRQCCAPRPARGDES